MSATVPEWRRWTLLATLFAIGVYWIVAFVFLRANSEDFIGAKIDAAARDRALAVPATLPQELAFGRDTPANALLGDGWWGGDEDGAWSWSNRAHVFLRWPPAQGQRWLTFEGNAFVVRRRGQVVRLRADGELLGEWRVRRDNTVVRASVRLPSRAPRDGVLKLEFEVSDIGSPFRVDGGPDNRHLGFHLSRITLRDLPVTAPAPE